MQGMEAYKEPGLGINMDVSSLVLFLADALCYWAATAIQKTQRKYMEVWLKGLNLVAET